MKVLWVCNVVLPVVAGSLGIEGSNKEGWISGLADTVLARQRENGIGLSVVFPVSAQMIPEGQEFLSQVIEVPGEKLAEGQDSEGEETGHGFGRVTLTCYGFPEDVNHSEKYDEKLEPVLKKIVSIIEPDIVHCFGTEYPHTLAMCRVFPRKDRLLVGLQGLCTLIADAYYANLPEQVIRSVTLRDWLRKDSLRQQKEKFVLRGQMERESVGIAGNITGRTRWDREQTKQWNKGARYHGLNETLRKEFYGAVWEAGKCVPHSIFLSQGDYPLKGLHYMLLALPDILKKYPDTKVFVAGNSLVGYETWKQKLKISAYGKYLRGLLNDLALEDKVTFLGKLDAGQMRDRYLKSHLFVCCSSLENSPNSLGEAMLLGMPCVSADVGGISSMFTGGVDGILYEGFGSSGLSGGAGNVSRESAGDRGNLGEAQDSVLEEGFADDGHPDRMLERIADDGNPDRMQEKIAEDGYPDGMLERIARRLAEAVMEMWGNPGKMEEYCRNARKHAMKTHNREENYQRLVEIYGEIL